MHSRQHVGSRSQNARVNYGRSKPASTLPFGPRPPALSIFHHSPLSFLCVTFALSRGDQITQTIRRIITANTILIGIHLEHILRPIRIVLQRRQTLDQRPQRSRVSSRRAPHSLPPRKRSGPGHANGGSQLAALSFAANSRPRLSFAECCARK
jgi:hypothetical protein